MPCAASVRLSIITSWRHISDTFESVTCGISDFGFDQNVDLDDGSECSWREIVAIGNLFCIFARVIPI